jgi:hypothetical protein
MAAWGPLRCQQAPQRAICRRWLEGGLPRFQCGRLRSWGGSELAPNLLIFLPSPADMKARRGQEPGPSYLLLEQADYQRHLKLAGTLWENCQIPSCRRPEARRRTARAPPASWWWRTSAICRDISSTFSSARDTTSVWPSMGNRLWLLSRGSFPMRCCLTRCCQAFPVWMCCGACAPIASTGTWSSSCSSRTPILISVLRVRPPAPIPTSQGQSHQRPFFRSCMTYPSHRAAIPLAPLGTGKSL